MAKQRAAARRSVKQRGKYPGVMGRPTVALQRDGLLAAKLPAELSDRLQRFAKDRGYLKPQDAARYLIDRMLRAEGF